MVWTDWRNSTSPHLYEYPDIYGARVTQTGTVIDPAGIAISTAVDWHSANGTAAAPGDYTPVVGTLVFKPYTTTLTVSVPVNSDLADEADEVFFVNLVNASTNASVADGQGTVTIDDAGVCRGAERCDVDVVLGAPIGAELRARQR